MRELSVARLAAMLLSGVLGGVLLAGCASPGGGDAAPLDVAVQVPSAGELLPGTLFVAAGSGPHPTLVWFHGFPGLPAPTPESIGILRGAGLNVLYLHYRGSWGTAGTFSATHALEDAAAALAFVRAPQAVAGWRIDTEHIVAMGDSFGSWVALQAAAADPAVACVAAALVLDLGRLGADVAASADQRGAFLQMFSQVEQDAQLQFRLAGGAEGLLQEIVAGRVDHAIAPRAAALRDRPVLLMGARQDTLAPVDRHLHPVAAALRQAGAVDVTQHLFPGGHELVDADYADALAQWVNGTCVR